MKNPRQPGLASETWELVFELLLVARPRVPAAAAECGLTSTQCHALRCCDRLAVSCASCRPPVLRSSNVTGSSTASKPRPGARRPPTNDRRVKSSPSPRRNRARSAVVELLGNPRLDSRLSS